MAVTRAVFRAHLGGAFFSTLDFREWLRKEGFRRSSAACWVRGGEAVEVVAAGKPAPGELTYGEVLLSAPGARILYDLYARVCERVDFASNTVTARWAAGGLVHEIEDGVGATFVIVRAGIRDVIGRLKKLAKDPGASGVRYSGVVGRGQLR